MERLPRRTNPCPARQFAARWLEAKALEVLAEGVREIGPGQRELDGGLEEPELLPGVVPLAFELDRVDRAAAPQHAQAVGELDLPAGVRRGVLEDREQVRRQHV